MRTITGLSILGLLALTAGATAQYPNPGGYGGGYSGGQYGGAGNGQYGGVPYGGSPLSPYLNLTNRGGAAGTSNPAVNYYNFVRPNLPNPNRMAAGFGGATGWGAKTTYFPTLQSLDEDGLPGQTPSKKKDADGFERTQLPPTGHAAGFSNTLGYFGPMMGAPGAGHGSAGRNPPNEANPARRR